MKVYGIEVFNTSLDHPDWEPELWGNIYLNEQDAEAEVISRNDETLKRMNDNWNTHYINTYTRVHKHNVLFEAGLERSRQEYPDKPEKITELGAWDTRYRVYEIDVIEGK